MKLECKLCGFENSADRLFCERCFLSLRQMTRYDISNEDFISDGDKDAFEILEDTSLLSNILNSVLIKPRMKRMIDSLSKNENSLNRQSKFAGLIEECADILSLKYLPEVKIGNLGQKNAFTTGIDERNIIVIDRTLMDVLSYDEFRSLLGHEMGHIKSCHVAYHSIAEIMERGMEFSASLLGMNLISMPMRLALKAWHRESEISADRASLIVSNSIESIASLFIKIIDSKKNLMDSNTDLNLLIEFLSSHPTHLNRLKALREFENSVQYSNIKKRLNLRKMLGPAFIEICKFCGAQKLIEEIFCPKCNRSLV